MKTLSDILSRDPVWVNPAHRIESAMWLMRGHNVGSLPVLEGSRLVGMLLYKHMLGVDLRKKVGEVMDAEVPTVPPTLSVREAADLMMHQNLARLPVVSPEGTLLGVITDGDLLAELRHSIDPLTELSWSDSLREWAIDKLQDGHEITLLFLDVNRFGQFNKRYGHVVGDTVLRNVANVLRDVTDPATDILCRYGGDEFCIATLRPAHEALLLAETIDREVAELRVVEAEGQNIGVTVGLRGGRRTREREQVHYASTINNLINLASIECLLKKQPSEESLSDRALVAALSSPRTGAQDAAGNPLASSVTNVLRLAFLDVTWQETTATIRVVLEVGTTAEEPAVPASAENGALSAVSRSSVDRETPLRSTYTGSLSEATDSAGLPTLIAETTMIALRRALPPEFDVRLKEVLSAHTTDERTLITVTGDFITPLDKRPIAGCAFVGANPHRAVAAAVLAATNHQVGRVLLQP